MDFRCLPLLLVLLMTFPCRSAGQTRTYFQQQADFRITVTLDDQNHALEGQLELRYHNHSPDTLPFLWFHLWPNACKNDQTALSEQLLELGNTDLYFAPDSLKGYIHRLDFMVNGTPAATEPHPVHPDIVKLLLPQPLAPGDSLQVETPFHVKLSYPFSRSGHYKQTYQVTQWYPKPAVYDVKGWHPLPYLEQGEFYGEFGTYDVSINTPAGYVVAATGLRTDSVIEDGRLRSTFRIGRVHDFAWFADRRFVVEHDTLQYADRVVEVYAYRYPQKKPVVAQVTPLIKRAVRCNSTWIGEYPYPVVSVVEDPNPTGGGMEYPTITLIRPGESAYDYEYTIRHEVGHNWFYGILASHERRHPWMDEGMNTYYDLRYQSAYPAGAADSSRFLRRFVPDPGTLLTGRYRYRLDQPIETPADRFWSDNYDLVAYYKAAGWMQQLERELGTPLFDSVMRTYYQEWAFRHPYPEDFRKTAERVSGRDLTSHFTLLSAYGPLRPTSRSGWQLSAFTALRDNGKHRLFFAPAAGYNRYDGFMGGLMLHNYGLPPTRLRFLVAPLYAAGSGTLRGLARASYTTFMDRRNRIDLFLSASTFSQDRFRDSAGRTYPLRFVKTAPGLRYTRLPESATGAVWQYQWKTYLFRETGLSYTRDTLAQKDIFTFPESRRTLNQLLVSVWQNRALYPYRIEWQTDQGEGFVRSGVTARYFLNYPKGGGLGIRFFAGAFFYPGGRTPQRRFATDRYHLNLSGANGYEDYTYSQYFAGRNAFEGWSSQQLMIRDGGFKVRTELLSNKIGKTDNWLTALNLTTTIPSSVNPLELLPFRLPVRLFLDIGTYAEAWDKDNNSGRFLYDAGIQVSLFGEVVNLYIPVIYSRVYREYYQSTLTEKRFLKTISFSVDIDRLQPDRLLPSILF